MTESVPRLHPDDLAAVQHQMDVRFSHLVRVVTRGPVQVPGVEGDPPVWVETWVVRDMIQRIVQDRTKRFLTRNEVIDIVDSAFFSLGLRPDEAHLEKTRRALTGVVSGYDRFVRFATALVATLVVGTLLTLLQNTGLVLPLTRLP